MINRIKYYNPYTRLLVFLGITMATNPAFASAIEKLNEKTVEMKKLIMGPLGAVIIILMSLISAGVSLYKGHIMGAVGIVFIGLLLAFHMENITAIFS